MRNPETKLPNVKCLLKLTAIINKADGTTLKRQHKASSIFSRFWGFIAVLLLILSGSTSWAEAGSTNGFNYKSTGTEVIITGYSGTGGTVEIPNSIEGLPVTGIGDHGFAGSANITNIIIPNGVRHIDSHAFSTCSSLVSVTIGNSVTNIGDYAFYYCSKLASITVPNSVVHIGDNAFSNCYSLRNITLGNGVVSIGNYVFSGCSRLASIMLPGSITMIGNFAFSGCSQLTSATIPNSVTHIGEYAFAACTSLASIIIPNSIATLENYVFSGCSSLVSATIPTSVTKIGNHAFGSCSQLPSVAIPSSVTNIGEYAFSNCTNLLAIYFSGDAPNVGVSVFDGDDHATVYYLTGTPGWSETFGDRPTTTYNNHAPIAAHAIPDQFASVNTAFSYTIPADIFADQDPDQTLTYGVSGLPSNFTFDPASRTLAGTATNVGAFTIEVVATDDGTPAMSTRIQFVLRINAKIVLVPMGISGGHFAASVQGIAGPDYVILKSDNLTDWTPVYTNKAPTVPWVFIDADTPTAHQFYRALIQ